MILILLKKLEIVFFIIVLVLTSFSRIYWSETFYWGVVCSSIIFEVILRIWGHLRKVPTLKFIDETVIVSGVKIHRCDITGWRILRASNQGERVPYIEIQLKRPLLGPVRWRLLKFLEQVPSAGLSVRDLPLAKEPRLIALLNRWDLPQPAIAKQFAECEQVDASLPLSNSAT
jgi:hypothetical protein